MSDSDSTWPATDDFGSRFLEIDDYNYESPETLSHSKVDCDIRSPSRRSEVRVNRAQRFRSYIALDCGRDEDDTLNEDVYSTRSKRPRVSRPMDKSYDIADEMDDSRTAGFRSPKLLTARQMSLHLQRAGANRSKHVPLEPTLLSLESLEPSKPVASPTPEQLAARQRSIARRRESAKNKAELQKRQTVERLLKINADSDGFRRRGRGRGTRLIRQTLPHSTSTTSILSTTLTNLSSGAEDSEIVSDATHPAEDEIPEANQDTVALEKSKSAATASQHDFLGTRADPPPNYIRLISSSRLSPCNRVCLPAAGNLELVKMFSRTTRLPPNPQLCSQGCGRLRRYSCSTTGLPLCSLLCYKTRLTAPIKEPMSTISSV